MRARPAGPPARRFRLAGILAIALGLIGACAAPGTGGPSGAPADIPGTAEVAVLPFENLSGDLNAGLVMTQLVTTELYRTRTFRLVEESEVRRSLAFRGIDPENLTQSTYAQQVAQVLQVHAVMIGSVTEYGYVPGVKQEPRVGMTARLVRASDGAVLWAASAADSGGGLFSRESLNETARRVVDRLLADLVRRPPSGAGPAR